MIKTGIILALTAVGASTCALDRQSRIASHAESQRCDLVASGLESLLSEIGVDGDRTLLLREERPLQAEMFIGALSAGDVAGDAWTATPRLAQEQRAIRRRLRQGLLPVEPCLDGMEDALGVRVVTRSPDAEPNQEAQLHAALGPLIVDRHADRAYLSVLTHGEERGMCWDAIQLHAAGEDRVSGSVVWNAPGSCFRL